MAGGMEEQSLLSSMHVSLIRAVLVATIIGLVFAIADYLQTLYRLRHFKGPFLAVTSKLWMMKAVYNKNLHLKTKEVCEKYGSIARISPYDLITNDPELILRMSAVRSPYRKSDFYSGTQFDFECNHVFSELSEERHFHIKRKLAPGYSGRENPFLEQSVRDRTLDLLRLIDRSYLSSAQHFRRVDFAQVAQFYTLDVISDVAFGATLGFLKRYDASNKTWFDNPLFQLSNEDINNYCQVSEKAIPVFEWAAILPSLNRLARLPILRNTIMPKPDDVTGLGMLMGFSKRVVAERFGQDKETKQDMLGSFVRHGLSQREAETEATFQMMAGSDTTVTALRVTTFYILTNPHVHAKVRQELDDAFAAGRLTRPVASESECSKLHYLAACIRESLRIWAPSFALLQKITPPEGDWFDGKYIPGSTRIGTCTYGLFHSKKLFGEDAETYRPERWLEASDEVITRMKRTTDLVFGSGRYQCLGKSLAHLELQIVLATLFYRYDMSLMDPIRPWKAVAANGVWLQKEMFLRIEPRAGKWEVC